MFSAEDANKLEMTVEEKPRLVDLVEVVIHDADAKKLALRTFPETPTWTDAAGVRHSIFSVADVLVGTFWLPAGPLLCEIRRTTHEAFLASLLAAMKVVCNPASIVQLPGVELLGGLREVGVIVALGDEWPGDEDTQVWAGLALAGTLAEAGVGPEDAARIVGRVAELGGDWDASARVDAVGRTYSRYANRLPIVSKRKLESIVGRRAVRYALNMLTGAPAPQAPIRILSWEDLHGRR